jgi:hypothetical protein
MKIAVQAFAATVAGLSVLALWSPAQAQGVYHKRHIAADETIVSPDAHPRHWRHQRQVYYAPAAAPSPVEDIFAIPAAIVGGVTQPLFAPSDAYPPYANYGYSYDSYGYYGPYHDAGYYGGGW